MSDRFFTKKLNPPARCISPTPNVRGAHHEHAPASLRTASAIACAGDLIELDGEDLRREPLTARKTTLASVLSRSVSGLRLNDDLEHEDGPAVFAHAFRMGLEGIVSKRKGSRYSSGRWPDGIKSKNPEAPAVKREAEIDWSR